ncbi:hypothetical protein [Rhizobium leguminosarum]|uniref:hypothetical protein n=1 Tax=Rhizobium leguminosarum TaxID=384 RepID=UPI001AE5FF78|nr:hypothetical protein [Rhizobium leguminosarum]MBP2449630.1 hypothetical protein [Rhizobium leguminosarum]
MDSCVLLDFVDPNTDQSVTGSVTPSSVLDTIADVVGRYVASQASMATARAWATGLNHVPFLTPAGQLERTQTVTRPERDVGYTAIVTGLVLKLVPEAKQIIDDDVALQKRLFGISSGMRQSLMTSATVSLLFVLMTALPGDNGNAPVVKVYLVDRLITTIQTSDLQSHGQLNLADVISAYTFDFARMADAADLAAWQRFVSKTKTAGK